MFGSPQRVSVTVSSQPPPEAAGISNNLFALMSVQDSLVQHSRTVFATAAAVTLLIAYFLGKKDGALFALPFSIIGICIVGIWLIVLQSRLRSSAFVEQLITWSEEGKYVQKPFSLFKEYRDARFAKNDFKVTFTNGEQGVFTARAKAPLWSRLFTLAQWRSMGLSTDLWLALIFLGCWLWVSYEIYFKLGIPGLRGGA